jgi:zinc protease
MKMPTSRLALAALALGALAPGGARAADGGAAPGLAEAPLAKPPRTAADVVADVAKALGSDAAWKAHKNVRMKLDMTFQGMGISGSGERFATKDDKALVVTDLPGMGTIREGSNGKIMWSQDPINGARQLTGAEAEQARIEAVWNAELRTSELYKSVELAQSAPPGQECLVMTPSLAPAVTNCYDAKTHLQVSQKGTRSTPQGDTPFSSTLKDWREVSGLKMPFSVDTQAGPITFTAKMSDVRFDQPMDEKMFEPPGGLAAGDEGGKAKGKGAKTKHPKK